MTPGYNRGKEGVIMKIEKISDNQIRCTLTAADLSGRKIKISELAYGTEKARSLFRELMTQARKECGFEVNNIPLMIEAVPVNSDSIVLIITKVEDPEELDTRFSKFTPMKETSSDGIQSVEVTGADDIIDVFHKMYESKKKSLPKRGTAGVSSGARVKGEAPIELVRLYRFDDIDGVIRAACGLNGFYKGTNSLYHQKRDGHYLLVVHQSRHTPEEFNKICNILSEYSTNEDYTSAGEMHLTEHEDTVIAKNALQKLSTLN